MQFVALLAHLALLLLKLTGHRTSLWKQSRLLNSLMRIKYISLGSDGLEETIRLFSVKVLVMLRRLIHVLLLGC